MLIGFSTKSQREEVDRLAAKARFYRTLNAKLQAEIERARAEMDRLDPPREPVYTEKPINENLQTGESRLLGGEMRLTAPWIKKSED